MAAHPMWISEGPEEIGLSKYERSIGGQSSLLPHSFSYKKEGAVITAAPAAVILRGIRGVALGRESQFLPLSSTQSTTVRWECEPGVTAAKLLVIIRLRQIFPPGRRTHKDLGIEAIEDGRKRPSLRRSSAGRLRIK
jgi:hypothetical protein